MRLKLFVDNMGSV